MLSINELNDMDFDQLVKVLNRQAEKYNKQITRAKKAGIYEKAKELNPYLKRLPIISKAKAERLKEDFGSIKESALIKLYIQREKMEAGGATKSNIKKMEAKRARAAKVLDIPELSASVIAPKLDELATDAKARRDLYYEILKMGVEMGLYNSFADIDKPQIPGNKFDWYMRREVNKLRKYAEQYGMPEAVPTYNELYSQFTGDKAETQAIINSLL